MSHPDRQSLQVAREPAVLAAALLPDRPCNPHDPLDELRSLAETAGAIVVDELLQNLRRPYAGSFLGRGKLESLAALVRQHGAEAVRFDNDLTPRQIANIEKVVECKVLDRSELILDIFASRARTHEARLQVELAQLEYTYPRLRAMWSHLERIAGGSPAGIGTRGPGEQQLEIDRRIVQRRKSDLKREIRRVQGRKSREVAARNADFFTVGLVGYTNAGKSTLFNAATAAAGDRAYADDKLFATLSTRTRRWDFGGGETVVLSDTVGFIRDLPHHLVASFRATLEEAIHCDLLLVVLDAAEPDAASRLATVNEVLEAIGATGQPRQLVLNKLDRIRDPAELDVLRQRHPDALAVSAKTGEGVDALAERVRNAARGAIREMTLQFDPADGKAIQFVENRGTVLERAYENGVARFRVRLGERQLDQLKAMGSSAATLTPGGSPEPLSPAHAAGKWPG